MTHTTINDFSLLCRLLGNLFYRQPDDPILTDTFAWLSQGYLRQHWALVTDPQSEHALTTIEKQASAPLTLHYHRLFGKDGTITTTISSYGCSVNDFIDFRQQHNMPTLSNPDHVALLLLTASWIEDNPTPIQTQRTLFEQFLLPCLNKFLGQVEAFDNGFYKALAQLTRDALSAMADELEEDATNS